MRVHTLRLPVLFALVCGYAATVPIGCGPSATPDGGQINVTIPPDVAKKQNEAYKDYAKGSKKGKPPS